MFKRERSRSSLRVGGIEIFLSRNGFTKRVVVDNSELRFVDFDEEKGGEGYFLTSEYFWDILDSALDEGRLEVLPFLRKELRRFGFSFRGIGEGSFRDFIQYDLGGILEWFDGLLFRRAGIPLIDFCGTCSMWISVMLNEVSRKFRAKIKEGKFFNRWIIDGREYYLALKEGFKRIAEKKRRESLIRAREEQKKEKQRDWNEEFLRRESAFEKRIVEILGIGEVVSKSKDEKFPEGGESIDIDGEKEIMEALKEWFLLGDGIEIISLDNIKDSVVFVPLVWLSEELKKMSRDEILRVDRDFKLKKKKENFFIAVFNFSLERVRGRILRERRKGTINNYEEKVLMEEVSFLKEVVYDAGGIEMYRIPRNQVMVSNIEAGI